MQFFIFFKKKSFWLSFHSVELKYNKIPECANTLSCLLALIELCVSNPNHTLWWNSHHLFERLWFLHNATPGIILGTHREKGAHTFWSYALGLPLASSAVLSWKFCHVLHKVLRDGHVNVRRQLLLLLTSIDLNSRVCEELSVLLVLSPAQVLQDCMRHHSSIVEIGKLWVSQPTLL